MPGGEEPPGRSSEQLHQGLCPEHPLLIGSQDQGLLAGHVVRLGGDVPLAPPAPQRIPGRLRSLGPLSQPDVLLEPMDPSDLESWECGPLLPEAQQP